MTERPDDIIAIERGEMSEEDWDSMQKMATLYRGNLVMRQVIEQSSDVAVQPTDDN